MTRTLKYKELRQQIEKENERIKRDLTSDEFFARMRALYVDSFICTGIRAKR